MGDILSHNVHCILLSILMATSLLFFSVLTYSQESYTVTAGNISIEFSDRGIESVIANGIAILRALGFAAWGPNWSNFGHQVWSGSGIYIKHSEVDGVVKISIKTRLDVPAKMTITTNATVNKSKGVILLFVSARFDADCELQGLAWGAWGLPVEIFAGRYITVLEFGSPVNVFIPPQHESGQVILYSGSPTGLLVSHEKGTIGFLFINRTAHFSIEDEREWGSNFISFRVWFTNQPRRYNAGDEVSLSVMIFPNIDLLRMTQICSIVYEIDLVKGMVNLSERKEDVIALLNKAWNSLMSYDITNASRYVDEAYKLAISTVRTPYKFKWLSTNGTWIVDEDGFYVLLRGADYMGMEFGWFGHSEEDFARMASWGFNVVRLPIGWAYIEPEPNKYNEEYLKLIDRIIMWCKAHGLYVVLDMHQWFWSKRFNGCGLPDWLVPEAKTWEEASRKFFSDPKLWQKLALVWRILALRYKDEPAVAAYDLFNEPPLPSGVSLPEFTKQVTAFYSYLISEVRKVDKRHIIMYEPVWGGIYEGTPMISGSNIVLSAHLYIGGTADGVTGYEKTTFKKMEYEVRRWVRLAKRLGVPLWVGEFGVGSGAYKAREWARDMTFLFDKYVLGYAWWTYWRDEKSFGLLYPNGTEKREIVSILDRPYPMRSSAPIYTMRFYIDKKIFICIFNETSGDLISYIRISPRHYPDFPNGYDILCNQTDFKYEWNDTTNVLKIIVKNPKGFTEIVIKPHGVELPKEEEVTKPTIGESKGKPTGGEGVVEEKGRSTELLIYAAMVIALIAFIIAWAASSYKKAKVKG